MEYKQAALPLPHICVLESTLLPQFAPSSLPQNEQGLCCWNDTEPFTGTIYSYPERLDEDQKVYYVRGCFCSLGCAKQYLEDHGLSEFLTDLFHRMCREVYRIFQVFPIGSPLLLQKFSGPKGLPIDTYRSTQVYRRLLPAHMSDVSCIPTALRYIELPIPVPAMSSA